MTYVTVAGVRRGHTHCVQRELRKNTGGGGMNDCANRFNKNSELSFYGVPKNTQMRSKLESRHRNMDLQLTFCDSLMTGVIRTRPHGTCGLCGKYRTYLKPTISFVDPVLQY